MVKALCCDKCGNIIILTNELQSCECGNVSGNYKDWKDATWDIEEPKKGRCIGIDNNVRHGMVRLSFCWVFLEDWNPSQAQRRRAKLHAFHLIGFYILMSLVAQICPIIKDPFRDTYVKDMIKTMIILAKEI